MEEIKLETLMGAYDWKEAMTYSKFRFDQIEKVILAIEGFNDGPDWILLVELNGGGFGTLRACCDYTGWDCQSGGSSGIFETLELAYDWLKEDDGEHDDRIPKLEEIKK